MNEPQVRAWGHVDDDSKIGHTTAYQGPVGWKAQYGPPPGAEHIQVGGIPQSSQDEAEHIQIGGTPQSPQNEAERRTRIRCPFCGEPANRGSGIYTYRCGTRGPDEHNEYSTGHTCDITTFIREIERHKECVREMEALNARLRGELQAYRILDAAGRINRD